MEFPDGDDLEYCISSLLKQQPENFELSAAPDELFKVEIILRPWQSSSKDWCLNSDGQKIFRARVAEMFQFELHSEVIKKTNRKDRRWQQKEAIEHFMVMYDIPISTTNYERLAKDFQRWKNRGYAKKHRKKMIRKNSLLS